MAPLARRERGLRPRRPMERDARASWMTRALGSAGLSRAAEGAKAPPKSRTGTGGEAWLRNEDEVRDAPADARGARAARRARPAHRGTWIAGQADVRPASRDDRPASRRAASPLKAGLRRAARR